MLLENFEHAYLLGCEDMDQTHREFVALLNKLDSADKQAFIPLFTELVEHTEAHFATEYQWMQDCRFPALREHVGEHERVLGELHRFKQRVATGQVTMGRAYVREQLPSWFSLHAQTMDSALAAMMKERTNTMSEAMPTRCFISYSGVSLPLNLVNPLDSTANRNTYFRAHYDANERMVLCEKVVYGEVEMRHRYEYYPDGTLQRAEITAEDDDVQVLNFAPDGKRR